MIESTQAPQEFLIVHSLDFVAALFSAVTGLFILAGAKQVQGVPVNIKVVYFLHQALNFENPGIAKFNNYATLFADHVIVLLVCIRPLVVILIFPKLLALNQATLNQQIQGVIHRGTGYSCAGIFHIEKDIVCIKVSVRTIYLFKHHETLGSLALVFFF